MAVFTGSNDPLVVTAPSAGPVLSLADLGDGEPDARTGNRRYVCPLCSAERRKARKRDLSVNLATGAWLCWHCSAKGKLTDYWTERPKLTRKEQQKVKLERAFGYTPRPEPEHDPDDAEWRQWLTAAVPLAGTPGEAYLAGRGIPLALADACGVQYIANWYRRRGVVYPIRDATGVLAAAGVRYLDAGTPKTITRGKLALGVFATPGAFEADVVTLVEGPADALSLALAGRPAIALHRTSAPEWLVKRCAFKRVSVALDADAEGDRASAVLSEQVKVYGATATRLRPPVGKDWNDTLIEWGTDHLGQWLTGTPCARCAKRVRLPGREICQSCLADDIVRSRRQQPVHVVEMGT
jgi:hypothetical protein